MKNTNNKVITLRDVVMAVSALGIIATAGIAIGSIATGEAHLTKTALLLVCTNIGMFTSSYLLCRKAVSKEDNK